MARVTLLLPALIALVAAAPAAAAGPVPSTTTPPSNTTPPSSTTPPPTVPAAPATGTLTTRLERIGGASATVLAGDRVRVRGVVTPYVAGQKVVVRFYRGARKIGSRAVTVQPVKGGARGQFVLGFAPKVTGRIVVKASHKGTPQLATMAAAPKGFDVLPRKVDGRSTGSAIRMLQRRLTSLGYVVGQPGRWDARTGRAVLAFRKVTGMARTTTASEDVMRRIARGQGTFKVRYPNHGHHVEADLSLQVLALIDGGKVQRIYPISSGKPSTPTVLGSFHVYMKTPGTNAHGMVYSSFFIRGYAIHGYAEVPAYAASHGCLRVPIPDAVPIYDWVKMGDGVDVYA